MNDRAQQLKEFFAAHKKYFIIGGSIAAILLLILLTLPKKTFETLNPSLTPSSSPKPIRPATNNTEPAPIPPPAVSFEMYENRSIPPHVPQSANTYTFTLKTNYTVEEARSFGNKFGMTESKNDDPKFVVMSNLTDMNNRGMLVFDRETGGFQFQSWGDQRAWNQESGIKNQELQKSITGYLSSLGIIDPTVSCPTTYQKQGLTGVTYVECHRDWTKVGGTILNFVGLLNVPEDISLVSLTLGKPSTYTPDDPTIINTSDGTNGKARLTDFNTLTVGLTDDGRILTIDSNLRTIVQSNTIASDQLLTPQEALSQLITYNSQPTTKLSLTIPAGSGSVDWNKVYPGNLASGKKAVITDYLLTYLEKPGLVPQDNLVPMYVIRGTAELSSGYTVRFTETVPALKSNLSFLSPIQGNVAGASTSLLAQNDSGLKLGTFQPTITTPTNAIITTTPPTISPTIGQALATPTTSASQPGFTPIPTLPYSLPQCANANTPDSIVLEVPGLGTMIVKQSSGLGGPHTFYIVSSSFPIQSMGAVRQAFFNVVEQQYLINIAKWIEQNRSTRPTTVDESVQLFTQINKSDPSMSTLIHEDSCSRGIIAPPAINCTPTLLGGATMYFDMNNIASVNAGVARKLAEAANNGSLASFSSKPDIFPASTRTRFAWIFIDLNQSSTPYLDAACYISGYTPSLYLYPQSETTVSITLPSSLSFSYPSAYGNNWTVTAHPDGILTSTNNLQPTTHNSFSRLYYEYDKNKVTLTEPEEGFIVKKDKWEGFTRNTLAPKLGLTDRETDDLVTDVRNALVDVKSINYSYLKISLADPNEIDKKLPMSISPKPNVFIRINVILTPLATWKDISQPEIYSISRTGFSVLEVGARTR